MAEYSATHEVKVTARIERGSDHFLLKPPTTYATAEVRPPIHERDLFRFKRIVLGEDWTHVDVGPLFENAKVAVYVIESWLSEQSERDRDIEEIVRRLGHLANNPHAALTMMQDRLFSEVDRPFSERAKAEPKLAVVTDAVPNKEVLAETVPAEDGRKGGVTVHLAPVEIPPLTVDVPSLPPLEEIHFKSVDLPPVHLPETNAAKEPDQPSVFGPPKTGLTGFAPGEARILPWPPVSSDGRHARKEPNEN